MAAFRLHGRQMLRAARIFCASKRSSFFNSSFQPLAASCSPSSNLNWLWPASVLLAAAGSAPLLLCHEDPRSGDTVIKSPAKSLPSSFVEELRNICGPDGVSLDEDEISFHSKSVTNFHPVIGTPDVVVYPRCQEEIVAILTQCNKFKIPIVPFGGATSLEGQVFSPSGGVSMDMGKMKRIIKLNVEDMDVVVEPGIGWMELNEYLKPHGLFFPLDPGPGASIGGMCATRCSGSLAVRYGTMKDNVLAVKVVLANGDVLKTANRARKSAAGYDLTRLMIGSEGTLGVLTEVTLRLQKFPESSVVAICSFDNVKDAADVAIAVMHSGIQAGRLELLDEVSMRALNKANDKIFPEKPTLMFEFIGTDAYAKEQSMLVQKITDEHTGHAFTFFELSEEKEQLWKMRKEILWACLAVQDKSGAISTDVCVPLSRLAECISQTKDETDASFLMCATLAHAGDGNCHTLIVFDAANNKDVQEAKRLSDFIVNLALKMEGTCTGEHGIGVAKSMYLEEELGAESLRAMHAVKKALDPGNIMNPQKVLPAQFCF